MALQSHQEPRILPGLCIIFPMMWFLFMKAPTSLLITSMYQTANGRDSLLREFYPKTPLNNYIYGTSLVTQWLGILLPVQGTSPGLGRSHMPRGSWARAPQLLSPRATTTEAHAPRARAPQQEKPPQ